MMISIYTITCMVTGQVYVGKTKNTKTRFYAHKHLMQRIPRYDKCNRHLWNACQKYGIGQFHFNIIEIVHEDESSDCELKWMDHYQSCRRRFGFNMRRDSSTLTTVANETKNKMSESAKIRARSQERRDELKRDAHGRWSDNEYVKSMSQSRRLYSYIRSSPSGELLSQYSKLSDVLISHPEFKQGNIHAACTGKLKTAYGFVWKRVPYGGIPI